MYGFIIGFGFGFHAQSRTILRFLTRFAQRLLTPAYFYSISSHIVSVWLLLEAGVAGIARWLAVAIGDVVNLAAAELLPFDVIMM